MAAVEYYGTGRRKTSTARVFLRPGSGTVTVNRLAFEKFADDVGRAIVRVNIVNGKDIRVIQATGSLRLLLEAAQPRSVC